MSQTDTAGGGDSLYSPHHTFIHFTFFISDIKRFVGVSQCLNVLFPGVNWIFVVLCRDIAHIP